MSYREKRLDGSQANIRARARGYRNMEEMIMMSGMSVTEIAKEVGMTRQAIDRHVPEHMRGRAPTFSQRFYEAILENLEKARAARNTKKHDWGKMGQLISRRIKQPKGAGAYYTPEHIADPTSGSGSFLKDATDELTQNPPYSV